MAKEKKETAANAADESSAAKISFHVAILSSQGTYFTESFETQEELVARLKTLVNQDVSVFAFRGERLKISKPPFRHLLIPGAAPVALFDVPAELEEDETGYLGVDPINQDEPPQLKVPQPGRAPAAEPFFGDDDGDAMGVFDNVLPDPES